MVVLQSHHLDPLETILLAPLVNDAHRQVSSVDIPVKFRSQSLVLVIAEMAGVRRQGLARAIGSVISSEYEIRRALDRVFIGF